jgi:hypothetical protein
MPPEAKSTKRYDADQVASFLYAFLERHMTLEALESLLKTGWKARGSMSVHGFFGMLIEIHSKKHPRSHIR